VTPQWADFCNNVGVIHLVAAAAISRKLILFPSQSGYLPLF